MVDNWQIAVITVLSGAAVAGTVYGVVGCVRRGRALQQQRRDEERRRRQDERRRRERYDALGRLSLGQPGWRERWVDHPRPAPRSTARAAAPRPAAPPTRSAASESEISEEHSNSDQVALPIAPPTRSAASDRSYSDQVALPTAPPPLAPVRIPIRTISWAAGLELDDDAFIHFHTARNFFPLEDEPEAQIV